MKIVVIVLAGALGGAGILAACNNSPEPAALSTKRVDSVVAAAPDTIKAISLDSVKR
ncbi:MAG TPA: hypothetical protein VNV35_12630 [Puia sp.]|jgi:hypothetical protein|nr:hypothetical protein [Puia sp.]